MSDYTSELKELSGEELPTIEQVLSRDFINNSSKLGSVLLAKDTPLAKYIPLVRNGVRFVEVKEKITDDEVDQEVQLLSRVTGKPMDSFKQPSKDMKDIEIDDPDLKEEYIQNLNQGIDLLSPGPLHSRFDKSFHL